MSNAAVNICVQVELLGPIVTVLHLIIWITARLVSQRSGHTILHFYQPCARVPVSSYPHQHLLIWLFLVLFILTNMKWYLSVVLIAFLITKDISCLFICFLAICVSSLEYVYSDSLLIFYLSGLLLSYKNSLYILDTISLLHAWFIDIFSHSLGFFSCSWWCP